MVLPPAPLKTVTIRVRGTVQGVGFRPTVWRLAQDCGLTGTVANDAAGVSITLTGRAASIALFLERLPLEVPPLAQIEAIETQSLATAIAYPDFQITASVEGNSRTQIAPDAAICAACLQEVMNSETRRYRYPFTTCTHCGPRWSMVTGVPYDRSRTTMADFPPCADCAQEYGDPCDRRFHAQAIACPACGPQVWLARWDGNTPDPSQPEGRDDVDVAAQLIQEGFIVAIRGVGGFHLACDATNERTVQRLRQRKRRYSKPFALMARDLAIMRRYCRVTALEQQILESPAAPIVLLTANGPETLPDSVAPGYSLLGFMLPYTPLHGLLLEQLDIPVVMTSGNLSQEPQVISNAEAQRQLSQIAEIALFHNREIAHRIDDSVVRIMGGQPCLLRRARGYTPSALPLPPGFELAPEVLAYGGELKSTFCLVKDGAAIVSQHQGDLEDLATFEDYQQNLQLYTSLYDHQPQLLACDLHPEYLSTQLAQDQSERQNLPLMEIQHHHAHIASCLVDNHVPLSTLPVLGITLDGLGLGADGTLWGGEFLLADYCHFHRLARLKPVAMIGGVQAIQEPWRNTYAHLVAALGWSTLTVDFPCLDLYRYLALKPLHLLDTLLANGINSPPASSCGRLFDAVSAAVGLCRERVSYEGQGAIALEMAADSASLQDPTQAYPFGISSLSDPPLLQIEPQPMWQALLVDLKEQVPVGVIAARFHLGLARTIGTIVQRLAFPTLTDSPQFQTVVLSGGCFQNKILLEEVTRQVEAAGLSCLAQAKVPAHDGGLALGQGAIAAARQLCLP